MNSEKTKRYFQSEYLDFQASYIASRNIRDVVRRFAFRYNRKAIEGRMEALLDLVGDHCSGMTILDVGSGPGICSIKIAQRGATVSGIDYSEGMVEVARKHAREAGIAVEFVLGDFLSHPFDATYDVVLAAGVIEYIDPTRHQFFLEKMRDLSAQHVIVSFPKKFVLHAFVRYLWLRFFKGVTIAFFSDRGIRDFASRCGLEEVARRDVGILWVIKFVKRKL